MTDDIRSQTSNHLLRSLSPAALAMLAPSLEPVVLPRRTKLAERARPCGWAYFLSSGIASVIAEHGTTLQEMGIFGREGAGCISIILGAPRAPNQIVMQVPGTGHRIPASVITAVFHEHREVRETLLGYLLTMVEQVSQTALANTQLNISQRLARWLLMIHDRVDGSEINLTHDYLSLMLGVARPGVTVALQSLERSGLITTARGRIGIVNRHGLAVMTAGLYSVPRHTYAETG